MKKEFKIGDRAVVRGYVRTGVSRLDVALNGVYEWSRGEPRFRGTIISECFASDGSGKMLLDGGDVAGFHVSGLTRLVKKTKR